ncbi:tRNA pseudouridine(38-40) synthase TruA [Alphaproteobacteria bacterium 46_93_T64]|nr:tRNA pseudouridine(38-40) synthase TruA [Alphaproteobacteria bacterium 46_93_T64]
MARYKVTIEYDGTGLVGWQRQKTGASVQQTIEEGIFAYCGEDIRIQGAGRTDAGVHALAQVASFDLQEEHDPATVMNAVNHHMRPARVVILDCVRVTDEFNARFSAHGRHYVYRICNRHSRLALNMGRAWHIRQELDTDAMQEAANLLIGNHDFSSFRAVACQAKSPIKTLDQLEIVRNGVDISIYVSAPSFLHNQVRAMVGTLSLVGKGQWNNQDVLDALAAKDRQKAGPNAPAHGLYLAKVDYPC